jgi:hypothetical protein
MQRVSSNLTIVFKIFLPVAWITFFGAMTIAFLIADQANLPFGGGMQVRMGFLGFFILFLLLIYWFLIPLKRVEFGPDGIYVSNYFKTFRYLYIDIENIKELDLGIMSLGTISLKQKGKFGKKIRFIISQVNYKDFLQSHPQLFSHLLEHPAKK